MVVNHNDITVPVHGGLLHSVYILIAKVICVNRGYTLKNTQGFSLLNKCPGIPDIYIEYEYKVKNEFNKLVPIKKSVCIEIETNLTKANYDKKMEQFSLPGVREPIIIDMNKKFEEFKKETRAEGKDYFNDILWAEAYIEHCIVL